MSTFVSHNSALEFCRLHRFNPSRYQAQSANQDTAIDAPTSETLRLANMMGLSLPVDTMVSTANARRDGRMTRAHLYSKALPEGSVFDIGNGLSVASPELTFLQLAADRPMIKLVELGMELCGTYSLPAIRFNAGSGRDNRAASNLQPITTLDRLRDFIAQSHGHNGWRNANTALQFIIENSASPMETIAALILSLPYKHGGFSLPKPEMNVKVDLLENKRFDSPMTFICDMYWAFAKVAAEYDSNAHHAIEERLAQDSMRRNALELFGINVVTVTSPELRDTASFRRIAFLIADHLGWRIRLDRSAGFPEAHRKLRKLLLG